MSTKRRLHTAVGAARFCTAAAAVIAVAVNAFIRSVRAVRFVIAYL